MVKKKLVCTMAAAMMMSYPVSVMEAAAKDFALVVITPKAPSSNFTGNYMGFKFVKGKLANGLYDDIYYKAGKRLTGFVNNVFYRDGKLGSGYYSNGYYEDGEIVSGLHDGQYYEDGKLSTGLYKSIYYKKGNPSTGIYEGKYYLKGKLGTGTYKGIYYVKGKKLTGNSGGLYYVNGIKFTGKAKNGLVYKNGKLVTGEIDNVRYRDGEPLNGVSKKTGARYEDGVLKDIKEVVDLQKQTIKFNKAKRALDKALKGNDSKEIEEALKKMLAAALAYADNASKLAKKSTKTDESDLVKDTLSDLDKIQQELKKLGINTADLDKRVGEVHSNLPKDDNKDPNDSKDPNDNKDPDDNTSPGDGVNPVEVPNEGTTPTPVPTPTPTTPSIDTGLIAARQAITNASTHIGTEIDLGQQEETPENIMAIANEKIPTNVQAKVTAVEKTTPINLRTLSLSETYTITITSTLRTNIFVKKDIIVKKAIEADVDIAKKLLDGKEITVPYNRSDSIKDVLKALKELAPDNALIQQLEYDALNIHRTEDDKMAVTVTFADGVETEVKIKEAAASNEANILASDGYTVEDDKVVLADESAVTGENIVVSDGATYDIYVEKDGEVKTYSDDLENGNVIVVTAQDGETQKTYTVIVKNVDTVLAQIREALKQPMKNKEMHPALELAVSNASLLGIDLKTPFEVDGETTDISYADLSRPKAAIVYIMNTSSLEEFQQTFKKMIVLQVTNERNWLASIADAVAQGDNEKLRSAILEERSGYTDDFAQYDYDNAILVQLTDAPLMLPMDVTKYATVDKVFQTLNETMQQALKPFEENYPNEVERAKLALEVRNLRSAEQQGTLHPQTQYLLDNANLYRIDTTVIAQLDHPEELGKLYAESFDWVAHEFNLYVFNQMNREEKYEAIQNTLHHMIDAINEIPENQINPALTKKTKLEIISVYQNTLNSYLDYNVQDEHSEIRSYYKEMSLKLFLMYVKTLGLEAYISADKFITPEQINAENAAALIELVKYLDDYSEYIEKYVLPSMNIQILDEDETMQQYVAKLYEAILKFEDISRN